MSDHELWLNLSDLPGFDPVGLRVEIPSVCTGIVVHMGEESNGRSWYWGSPDAPPEEDPPEMEIADRNGIILFLSDASTRDRLARFVAGGSHKECCAPEFKVIRSGVPPSTCWVLSSRRLVSANNVFGTRQVPTLADLDPTDDTRLPDGSRRVDAIALGRVAVHVARGER